MAFFLHFAFVSTLFLSLRSTSLSFSQASGLRSRDLSCSHTIWLCFLFPQPRCAIRGKTVTCTSLRVEWPPTSKGRSVRFDLPRHKQPAFRVLRHRAIQIHAWFVFFSTNEPSVHPTPGHLPLDRWSQARSKVHAKLGASRLFFIHAITVLRETPHVRSSPRKLLRSSYARRISSLRSSG